MNIFKTFITLTLLFSTCLQSFAEDSIRNVVIVMRIPTYNAKIKYLDAQISKKDISAKKRNGFLKIKKETEQQRDKYFSLVYEAFNTYYTATEVYFVPDTLYKNLLRDETKVYISTAREITHIDLKNKKTMFMIQGRDEYQLLLTNQEHMRPEFPWPYKKGTFLGAIKSLINKKSYIKEQVSWFDKEMMKAINLYKIRQ
ncbi:MAG: hypothetical protein WAT22_18255 [Saprospiraceae bacterium]